MPWPDIFFKSRKPKPLPEIATVPPKAVEPPVEDETAKIEAAKAEAAKKEKEKVESLRALAQSGLIQAPPRIASKEVPIPTRIVLAPTEAKDASVPAVNALPVELKNTPAPAIVTTPPAPKPAEDKANAKTAVLPAAVPRPGSISLRQVAKLTDDAHLPKKDEPLRETSPLKPAESATPSAVVPPSFPVPVEAGTVLEEKAEKIASPTSSPSPEPAKPVETAPVIEKPPVEAPKNDAPNSIPPVHQETASAKAADVPPKTESAPTPAPPSTAIEPVKSTDARSKQEFVLANGERILGHVLSETPQTIYLDHGTLGVLTLPRSQIATKPIEVILINGDRIVGDLIAETPDCLYIKHASLGMLTVPHGQRSTRVVEAILKDGDRILGEVLAETDHFTVIRSATLGTVAVQHEQVAMLNRKIEQMQLRALPDATPALENKKD